MPCSIILDKASFENFLKDYAVVFFGSGAEKWKNICQNKNAFFHTISITSKSMSYLSEKKMKNEEFADIIYSEPFYVKEFY